jgi:hypothetical protein
MGDWALLPVAKPRPTTRETIPAAKSEVHLVIREAFRSLPGTPYCVPCLSKKLWIPSDRCLCWIANSWLLLPERWAEICQTAVLLSEECEAVFQEDSE